ncbi:hypothetical protein IMY05_002G0079600 [Salix suchowensis]|nr:hypothetical protein IMY05_002G0079600 [Salix suchowensis]
MPGTSAEQNAKQKKTDETSQDDCFCSIYKVWGCFWGCFWGIIYPQRIQRNWLVALRCLRFAMEPMQMENYFGFGELEAHSHATPPLLELSKFAIPYGPPGSLSVSERRQKS